MENDNQELGDNYYFLHDYEAVDIGFPDGAVIYKATQKNVFNNIKIHGNVVGANSNNDFIIAIQKLVCFTFVKILYCIQYKNYSYYSRQIRYNSENHDTYY